MALSNLEVFTPQSLVKISQNLDHFLPTLLMDTQLKLQKLSSPKTVAVIIQKAVDWFIDEYSIVYEAVTGPNGVEHSWTVWPRTVEEVRILLG